MKFRGPIWERIATLLSILNFAGAGFAIATGEGWHAAAHVGLALAFGAWAQRAREQRVGGEPREQIDTNLEERLEALEGEMTRLRHELTEAQERLDFTERLLVRSREPNPK